MKKYSPKLIIACIILVLLIISIVFYTSSNHVRVITSDAGVTKPSEPGARDIDLVISEGKIVSGSNEIKIKKGERVYIHFQTQDEAPMELELDGYDIDTEMSKYDFGGFIFTADKVGKFNIKLLDDNETDESAGEVIGVVNVEN